MAEQREGSSQVLEALKSMKEITSQVKSGSLEMSAGNKTVLEQVEKLRNATSQTVNGMETMAGQAGELNAGAQKVSRMARDTVETVGAMSDALARFKTSWSSVLGRARYARRSMADPESSGSGGRDSRTARASRSASSRLFASTDVLTSSRSSEEARSMLTLCISIVKL